MSQRRTTHPPAASHYSDRRPVDTAAPPRLMVMGPQSALEMDRKGTLLLSSDKWAMKKGP